MTNFIVENLDALLEKLRTAGVRFDPKPLEESEYGRFAWIFDPEGRKIELWEPPLRSPGQEG
jgi:predicted enzyme related to lactoylglutathione lyase